jgi:NitT/TauT family transport system permease protein
MNRLASKTLPVTTEEQKPRRNPWRARLLERLPTVIMGLALIGLYAWGRNSLPQHRKFLMPSFAELWFDAFGVQSVQLDLLTRLGVTAQIALLGLLASVVIGMALGVAMFRYRWIENATYPYLVALQSIPILAIVPLIQTAFGFGLEPKILVAFIISFFPIPTTLLLGLKSVDPGLIDLFKLQKASWWTTLRKVGLPASMPQLFAGFRISAGLSVIGAIVGELFFRTGQGGLGQLLINAKINFQYPVMYAALIVSSLLSISVFLTFSWLGDRLFAAWHESGSKST